jgi:hypothetical protein
MSSSVEKDDPGVNFMTPFQPRTAHYNVFDSNQSLYLYK